MKRPAKDGLSLVGLGAAACVACCAGPIIAFLGGLSVAGLASTWLLDGAGLLIAAAAAGALALVRRRDRTHACTAGCTDACTSTVEPQVMAAVTTKEPR